MNYMLDLIMFSVFSSSAMAAPHNYLEIYERLKADCPGMLEDKKRYDYLDVSKLSNLHLDENVAILSGRSFDPKDNLLFVKAEREDGVPVLKIYTLRYLANSDPTSLQREIISRIVEVSVTQSMREVLGDNIHQALSNGEVTGVHVSPVNQILVSETFESGPSWYFYGKVSLNPAHVSRETFEKVVEAFRKRNDEITRELREIGLGWID